ncbi:sterol desaturase family protein [Sandarakinorhabdus rubra]|uniref:sterol desaturase family protein n=1 Tax=Sandarakinorhabdus rubra TaxID=2672568 RepID=UPI001F34453A|nr:sterol desaturase family protein [Sandarakinorhabdus rubra]
MTLLNNEAAIRLTVFAAVLLAMLGWQALAPARTPRQPGLVRQANNIALLALDTALVRLLFPVLAVGLALRLEGSGLLLSALPRWLAVVAALILFDLAIYWQHRLFHLIPALWRLHRVHHADPDFDVTTALRFHPGEIILSMLIKLGLVWLLRPPAEAVLIFEILLNASSMFNHGNVRLPAGLERTVRRLVVTPDLHRVHHSAGGDEMNHNFGFCLSLWDRWFGTMVAQPAAGHAAMRIGLPGPTPTRRELWLDRLLLMPWRPAAGRD